MIEGQASQGHVYAVWPSPQRAKEKPSLGNPQGWEMKAAPIETEVASFLNDSRSCSGLRMMLTPTFEHH
jgi:hypothetical protein